MFNETVWEKEILECNLMKLLLCVYGPIVPTLFFP